jgi:hypothetical protein
MRLGGLGKLRRIHLIGTRTRDLPACSIVPQPTTLPCAPNNKYVCSECVIGKISNYFSALYIMKNPRKTGSSAGISM